MSIVPLPRSHSDVLQNDGFAGKRSAGRTPARSHPAVVVGWLLVSVWGLAAFTGIEPPPAAGYVAAADVLAVRADAWVAVPGGRVHLVAAVTPAPRPGLAERRDAVRAAYAFAPSVEATLRGVIVPAYDTDSGGDLDPGERLIYHVEITNSGGDPATGVSFDMQALDANTELVENSRQTSPLALDDAYTAIGNTQIVIDAANGVIQGGAPGAEADVDPDPGATLSVVGISGCADTTAPFVCATTQGGSVSMAADGAFTYSPPAGYEGSDTFTYILSDGTTLPDDALGTDVDALPDPMPTSGGTVTVSIAESIWFVDDGVSGGTGRSHEPFNLDEFNNSALDAANDFIFIRTGTHTDNATLQLLSGQKLVGEGVSLETFFLANQSSHASVPLGTTLPEALESPLVTNTAGNVVTLGEGNTITGLTLRPQAGAGIAGGSTAATTVSGVVISIIGAASDGISLSGHQGTFTFDDGAILMSVASSSGAAVRGVNSNGALNVTNSTIEFVGGRLVSLDNVEGGTSFNGTTVTTTDHDGVSVANSNAGTIALPGFTIASGTPAAVDAILLTNNTGATISLGVVNVSTSGARALVASGGGTINLAGTTSALSATSTRAVDLNGVTVGNGSGGAMTFASVSSTSSSNQGVLLTSLAGSLAMSGGAITRAGGATGDAFQVSAGSANVTYGGTISNATNNVISVASTTGGTITFNNGTDGAITDTGTGIFLNAVAGNVTVSASADLTGSEGIDVDAGSGTFTFADTDIALGSAGVAVDVNSGTATLAFQSGSSITQGQNTAAVNVTSHSAGTLDFDGGVNATNGTGLQFSNADGIYRFDGTTTLNGGDAGIDITTGSSGNFTFGATTAITNPSGIAYREDTSTAEVAFVGTITKNNNASQAVVINAKSSGSTIFSGNVTASTTTATAIDLTPTGGTVTFAGGLVITTTSATGLNATGTGTLNVTGSTRTITTSAGRALNISGVNAGGSGISFGSVTTTGATTTAVAIQNSTGTKSLGTLNLTTSNQTGLFGSSAGAISVTSGTINAGQGSGVDIDNTLLAISLTTVNSSSGSAAGIDLQSTTGSFTVTGTGAGDCAANSANCTGGTISSKSGNGIFLSSVSNVSLTRMRLHANTNNGIVGSSVNGFTGTNLLVTSNGDAVDESGIRFTNLLGTSSLTSSLVEQSSENNVEIVNNTGTLNLTVSNSTFDFDPTFPALRAQNFNMEIQSTAVATVSMTNNTFEDAFSRAVQVGGINNAVLNFTFTGNAIRRISDGGSGLEVDASHNADVTFNISDNGPWTDISSGTGNDAIILFAGSSTTTSSSLIGTVARNGNVTNSGGFLKIDTRGQGKVTVSAINNGNTGAGAPGGISTRRESFDFALGDSGSPVNVGDVDVTVTGNVFEKFHVSDGESALYIEQFGKASPVEYPAVCLNIRNNTATVPVGSSDEHFIVFEDLSPATEIHLESGPTDCGGACATAEAHLAAQNTGLGKAEDVQADPLTLVAPGTCATPSEAMAAAFGTRDARQAEPTAPVLFAESIEDAEIRPLGDLAAVPAEMTQAETASAETASAEMALGETLPEALVEMLAEAGPGTTAAPETSVSPGEEAAPLEAAAPLAAPVAAVLHEEALPASEPVLLASAGGGGDALALAKERIRRVERDAGVAPPARGPSPPSTAARAPFAGELPVSIGTLPAGETVHIFFEVQVDDPVAAGTASVSNRGIVSGTNFTDVLTDDPDAGGTTATVTALQAMPVLGAVKSVSDAAPGDADGNAEPGETLTYTVTVTNTGNEGAASVSITDAAPTGTTFVEGSAEVTSNTGGGTVSSFTGDDAGETTLDLDLSGITGNGGAVTVTFQVTVDDPAAAGASEIANTAQVSATDVTEFDSNTATIPLVAVPDLALTKSDGGATGIAPGGTISYTLSYNNNGNQGASGVVLTETVPANATFNAGASTAGWACVPDNTAGSTCTLAIGAVAGGGAGGSATFAVTVNLPLAPGIATISNTASVADDGANGTDPTDDNSGSDTTPLTNPYGPVISEFDYEQGATDDAEFVELVNPTNASVELDAYELRFVPHINGVDPFQTVAIPADTDLGIGAFYLFCVNDEEFIATCDVDLGDSPVMRDEGPAAVALVHTATGIIVDVVSYEGDTPGYVEGTGIATGDDGLTAFAGFSRQADTDDNDADFALACVTPGAVNDTDLDGCSDPLPVELTSFTGTTSDGAVVLVWTTASETNNAGFDVEHRLAAEETWTRLGFVEGAGTTTQPRGYTYRVVDVGPGSHFFRLRQIDYDGGFTFSPEVEVALEVPRTLALLPNYPNPFNPATTISFTVPETGVAVLRVFNLLGQEIATLYDGTAEAGKLHEVRFDAGSLPTGVYVYTLTFGGKRLANTLLLVK